MTAGSYSSLQISSFLREAEHNFNTSFKKAGIKATTQVECHETSCKLTTYNDANQIIKISCFLEAAFSFREIHSPSLVKCWLFTFVSLGKNLSLIAGLLRAFFIWNYFMHIFNHSAYSTLIV